MSLIQDDLFRFNGKKGVLSLIDTILRKIEFRYMFYYRWYQSGKCRFVSRLLLRKISKNTSIQIGWNANIGGGFVIVHHGAIAVNNEAYIGNNCTIYHGVTIGMEFRGSRRGCPQIGNNVWFGPNSTVVGNVHIGDDVLLAPGTFVNFDVPSHSVVIGNPGRIIAKDCATEGYITRCR